ncbi:MAG: hypothetical protein O2894_09560 [Planctomycetota bacterium]|nr:hypothetical protein [Planctomycetota bacterium]
MGRLIGLLLGGAAIVFFGAYLLPEGELRAGLIQVWEEPLDAELLTNIKTYGAGVLVGVALLLFATRSGKDEG